MSRVPVGDDVKLPYWLCVQDYPTCTAAVNGVVSSFLRLTVMNLYANVTG